MKKLLGAAFGFALLGIFFIQVQGVAANKGHDTKPVTSPVTSPITCKPGWGFGDKNHCHVGPKGHDKDAHHDNDDKHDHDDHDNHGHR